MVKFWLTAQINRSHGLNRSRCGVGLITFIWNVRNGQFTRTNYTPTALAQPSKGLIKRNVYRHSIKQNQIFLGILD